MNSSPQSFYFPFKSAHKMLVSGGHFMLCTLYCSHTHPVTRSCPHIPLELSHQLHLFKRLTCDLAQSLTLSRSRWERQVTTAWRQLGSGQEPWNPIHGFTLGAPARGGNLVHCFTPGQFEPWNTQFEGIWTFLCKLVFQFFLGNGWALSVKGLITQFSCRIGC